MARLKSIPFYHIFALVFLLCALQSCVVSKINPKAKAIDQVYFFQNGTSYAIKDDVAEVKLRREDFAIQCFNKVSEPEGQGYHMTKIAAVPNEQLLDKVIIGIDAKQIANFEPGSGLAVSKEKGYEKSLYINDYGHHNLFYVDDTNRTTEVIGKKSDYLLFQFEVTQIFEGPHFIPIGETEIETLYFAIYADFNQNKKIDAGELKKITVHLGQD